MDAVQLAVYLVDDFNDNIDGDPSVESCTDIQQDDVMQTAAFEVLWSDGSRNRIDVTVLS